MGQMQPTAAGRRRVDKDWDHTDPRADPEFNEELTENFSKIIHFQMRERMLHTARGTVLRDAINTCYWQYGVNHSIACRPIYIEYLNWLQSQNEIKMMGVADLKERKISDHSSPRAAQLAAEEAKRASSGLPPTRTYD